MKLNILGEEITIVTQSVFGKSWFPRKTPRNLRGNKNPSLAQAKAQYALALAAHNNIGTYGVTNGIPSIAYAVQQSVPQGEGVHGGMSKQQRLESKRVSPQRMERLARRAQGLVA